MREVRTEFEEGIEEIAQENDSKLWRRVFLEDIVMLSDFDDILYPPPLLNEYNSAFIWETMIGFTPNQDIFRKASADIAEGCSTFLFRKRAIIPKDIPLVLDYSLWGCSPGGFIVKPYIDKIIDSGGISGESCTLWIYKGQNNQLNFKPDYVDLDYYDFESFVDFAASGEAFFTADNEVKGKKDCSISWLVSEGKNKGIGKIIENFESYSGQASELIRPLRESLKILR